MQVPQPGIKQGQDQSNMQKKSLNNNNRNKTVPTKNKNRDVVVLYTKNLSESFSNICSKHWV